MTRPLIGLAAVGSMLLGVACGTSYAGYPVAVPRTCDKADCGSGSCDDGGGKRDAVCTCAPGQFRRRPYECVTPETLPVNETACTSPEHCSLGQVCERLSGRCITPEPAMCGNAARPTGGKQPKGGFCYYTHAPNGKAGGCGDITDKDICAHGLLCAATSPQDISVICGYPTNRAGVCRPACDPCAQANGCGTGEGCFVVRTDAGQRGVCMPVGRALGECGEVACGPGESCRLHGTIGGLAVGSCVRFCAPAGSAEGPKCPEGQLCEKQERFENVGICRSVSTR